MYILPNKKPINMDKLKESFLDLDLKNIYYLDTETGEIQKNMQISREVKEQYFIVPKLSEDIMISWMKEFAEEMVLFDTPELGEKLLIELKKENPMKCFMDKLTMDEGGWIHGWSQWEVDHVFEEIIEWFFSLPINIEDDMSELDDDCPLCWMMKEGITDEETIKKGFQELKAKQMVDSMFKKNIKINNMSKKSYKNIYQFKITLKNIQPSVWRRVQVPENYSFWDLHVAIQNSFGWSDYHLHEFTTINNDHRQVKRIGLPDTEMMDFDILPGWGEKISDWFSLDKNKAMNYTYDFGDNWEHRVQLEKIIPKEDGVRYPVCIKGKRACPPEDSGSVWGYEEKLKILKNPEHPEYDEILEWMGEDFNSEEFNCVEVVFDNPSKRLKNSGVLEHIAETSKNSKSPLESKEQIKPKMDWEIDYSELPYSLKDKNGNEIKPLLLAIVHPESYFIIGSHFASPNSDYLQEFLGEILKAVKSGYFLPTRILVKKKDLFDLLERNLREMNIELEMINRTKAVESVKKEMGKFFKQ